ncbi:epidermal growth factor receptor kinase substrate 8-like protein 3 isoform X1 [Alosa alosa]|nr:epidermal growth factor receptor kinase substrate 8-like protein 3 isoform X1 [Alosa alosa]XP_048110146.1 epidermal growth factor receptor kinase substrate 8-like protein 3 isoform X1 [Alosa alosa]
MYQDPYSFDTSSYASSVISNGFSVETSSQMSNISRPSGKSIYSVQRKEYVKNINNQMGRFQYRVEHLFTCDMDGRDVNLDDCIERLNMLEAMGSVWGQDMFLQVRDGSLQLIDIETKEELETHPVSNVLGVQAVLDNGTYNSLLTVAVWEERKMGHSVFMFQSDSLRADYIKQNLDRAINYRRVDHVENRQPRDNLRAIMAGKMNSIPQNNGPASVEWVRPEQPPMEWDAPDYDDSPLPTPTPPAKLPEPVQRQPSPPPPQRTPTPPPYTEKERNVDILNHLINDIEAFMDIVVAVAPKEKRKKKKEKKKKLKAIAGMPSPEEFEICFQKLKFAFNLLGELNGKISDPSAADLVHVFFSILTYLVNYCSEELPPSIVVPLLIPESIRLMSEEATTEEDQFWQTLGDAWNIPSTQWPDDDEEIPEYFPTFDDGWIPPDVTPESQRQPQAQPQPRPPSSSRPISRQPSHHTRNETPLNQAPWKPPPDEEEEEANYMRVIFDFTARNQRELSISKGEIVQLLDMSKQWWKVRNNNGEVGHVPNNVLEPLDKKEREEQQQVVTIPNLTKKSKPPEVKAWLEYKGFNKITVRCLSMLSGASLLGMTREELKMICPDEGGRVFFQLQNVKAANALASEVRHME